MAYRSPGSMRKPTTARRASAIRTPNSGRWFPLVTGGYDVDAQIAFTAIEAVPGATFDYTELNPLATPSYTKVALNSLIVSLKGHNLWSKFVALHLYVGKVAGAHAIDWKNHSRTPMVFYSSFTHNANGATGVSLGSTYALPNIHCRNELNPDSYSIGLYTKTSRSYTDNVAMGQASFGGDNAKFILSNGGSTFGKQRVTDTQYTETDLGTAGFLIGTRVSSSDLRLFRNGSQVGSTNTGANTNGMPNNNMVYFALGVNGTGSTNRSSGDTFSLMFVGTGLTPTDITNLQADVTAWQTALGRSL